jgi:hypothetical protein
VTAAPELDAQRGRLRIAEPTLTVLVAHAADPVGVGIEGADEELSRLAAAGIIAGGRAHPAIADALAAIVAPDLCTLELAHSGRSMKGWVSYDAAALLLPPADEEEELRTLLAVHPTLLPDALARLVDLGPRPRAAAPEPVVYEEGAIDGVRRRWTLRAAWSLAGGRTGADGLEVLDTDDGLWLLAAGEGDELTAFPVTPTFVWRHLVRLVMRRAAA